VRSAIALAAYLLQRKLILGDFQGWSCKRSMDGCEDFMMMTWTTKFI
jgi:hypothetical protein